MRLRIKRTAHARASWFSLHDFAARRSVQERGFFQKAARRQIAMCGIAGFLKLSESAAQSLDRYVADKMVGAMWRRGPDGEGQWRSKDEICWLGHRRLAVIDLHTGDQPMTNEDGTLWTVFNGEIYNYKVLRAELVARGHRFRTASDTEVLVHGYEEWGGEDLAKRLQGIFAFAVYNTKTRSLFLARDQLGVKPLHWWTDGSVFLFASEIKSLLCHPGLKSRHVNTAGVAQFLVTRYVSRPNTILRDVYKLPEGSCVEIKFGQKTQPAPRTYWDASYLQRDPLLSFDEAVEQLDALLKETVRAQLVADVPVGAQLSGGVDSSVIVALMEIIRRETGDDKGVKTFSVGFDSERFSELKYAKLIANRYKTDHHEIILTARDFLEELPLLSWIYDEPMGEAPAVPTYLMCKMAKQKVTVMLCGEGADEQFGGYRKYPLDQLSQYVDWMPRTLRRTVLRGAGALLPFRLRRIRSILEILSLADKSSRFASWYGAFDTATKEMLMDPELQENVGDVFLREVFDGVIASCDSQHSLDQFLYCDIHTRLVDTLLLKADRMSMGAGIESRVPFLDPKVVSFAAGLPRQYKVKGLRTKILLKKVAERYAPKDVIYRRKVGFVMPLTEWFRGPMRVFVKEVLLGERSLSRGYFNPDAIERIVNDHVDGRVDREQGIWVLLALELWHRLYLDDDGTEDAVSRLRQDLRMD